MYLKEISEKVVDKVYSISNEYKKVIKCNLFYLMWIIVLNATENITWKSSFLFLYE